MPVQYIGLPGGFNTHALRLVFASVGTRTIKVLGGNWQVAAVRVLPTAAVTPLAEALPRIAVVGDSFVAQLNYGGAVHLRRRLGIDMLMAGISSTGVVADGGIARPYGAATRLAAVIASNPDAIVVQFSTNDNAGLRRSRSSRRRW